MFLGLLRSNLSYLSYFLTNFKPVKASQAKLAENQGSILFWKLSKNHGNLVKRSGTPSHVTQPADSSTEDLHVRIPNQAPKECGRRNCVLFPKQAFHRWGRMILSSAKNVMVKSNQQSMISNTQSLSFSQMRLTM